MFGLGFGEVILVFVIALIFIGPKKLPELAKGLGQTLRQFQDAMKGVSDQLSQEVSSSEEETKSIETPQPDVKKDPETKA